MADKVNVGDVVLVTMSREIMRDEFGYEGLYDKGMVGTVGRVASGSSVNFRMEGEENGFCAWLKPAYVELVTKDPETPTEPVPFGELDSTAKGMLLLDHHEGKPMQFFMGDHWFSANSPMWADDTPYRTKPQELIDAELEVAEAEKRTVELKAKLDEMAMTL